MMQAEVTGSAAKSATLDETLQWMHLLGDSTRVRLLRLLEQRELSVAELVDITELGQSRVSTHLGKLREARMVHDRRVGASTRYRVHAAMPAGARALWSTLRSQIEDGIIDADTQRLEAWQRARSDSASWAERIAGEMERHYSPGRTWEALGQGLCGLMSLGEVLDIGCGDGWTGRMVAPRARRYTGIDLSPKLIDAARARLRAYDVELLVGDMHALPFDDASFDQVVLFHALTYAEEPGLVLREAARVTRPGGCVAVLTLDAHSRMDVTEAYGHVNAGLEPEALRALLQDAGLRVRAAEVTTRERRKPHFATVAAFADKFADALPA